MPPWFGRYVPVSERKARNARESARLARGGREPQPVRVEGRTIARTFWGRSWCANLEAYSDYASRLPRGRSYLRSGSVLDLQVTPGRVEARVLGSALYEVEVGIAAIPQRRWAELRRDCAGTIDSLVELLQGHLSRAVMERVCRQRTGLFPSPDEIAFRCSCPDLASMCKHVASVLYGIGARLDERPELLFELRQADAKDLVAGADAALPLGRGKPPPGRVLEGVSLAEMFGVELGEPSPEGGRRAKRRRR